uniref:Uncharacterized protein n=1 Tax=Spongospora subterranea TaxID=70186 RepID=A0A0H5RMH4_9EUKA|eukprot:CRZ09919.1 hypothetical protein [Spongospora subterranea]
MMAIYGRSTSAALSAVRRCNTSSLRLSCRIPRYAITSRPLCAAVNHATSPISLDHVRHCSRVMNVLCRIPCYSISHRSVSIARNHAKRCLAAAADADRMLNLPSSGTVRELEDHAVQGYPASRIGWSTLALARPEMNLIVGGTMAMLVGTVTQLAIPVGFSQMVDGASTSSTHSLPAYLPAIPDVLSSISLPSALATLFLIASVANAARIQCFALASARLVLRVRQQLFDKFLAQPVPFFDRNRPGDLVTRLSNDVLVMGNAISGETLANGGRYSLQLVSTSAIMFYISPVLSSVLLGVGPAIAASGFFYGRYVKRISKAVQARLGEASSTAEEKFNAVRTVKAFVMEDYESHVFNQSLQDVYRCNVRAANASSVFNLFTSFIGNASLLSVLSYGTYLIQIGQLTPGQLTAFGLYTLYFGMSIVGLSKFYGEFMKGVGSSQRVLPFLQSASSTESTRVVPNKCFGGVEFRNVSFSYPTRPNTKILNEVSVTIEPNSIVALVGQSGSGKSTFASLLLKFYDVNAGQILLDGISIAEIDTEWLRKHIGIVSQDPDVFHGTIADNIRYGMLSASNEHVVECARAANIDFFIQSLPMKYDTIIGQNGVDLSGGQKQRLAIARAILKNPGILILDEATSALDAQNEKLINNALAKLMSKRTTILIAHRQSTFCQADKIVLLRDGHVFSVGSHTELKADPSEIGDYYRNLIQLSQS